MSIERERYGQYRHHIQIEPFLADTTIGAYTPITDKRDPMTNQRRRRRIYAEPDPLERELDRALEETFPASDPIAIDSADVHEERRHKAQRESAARRSETRATSRRAETHPGPIPAPPAREK